jgi:hypothetical protein
MTTHKKAKQPKALTLRVTDGGKSADGRQHFYTGQLGSVPLGTITAKSAAKAAKRFKTLVRKAL